MISLRVAVALAVLIAGLSSVFSAAVAFAQSPAPTILIDPLDPRGGPPASGTGAPLLALLVVVGAGIVAAALTALYVKATRRS